MMEPDRTMNKISKKMSKTKQLMSTAQMESSTNKRSYEDSTSKENKDIR